MYERFPYPQQKYLSALGYNDLLELSIVFLSALKGAPSLSNQLPLFCQLLLFADDFGFPSLQLSLVCGADLGHQAVDVPARIIDFLC